jgi:P27 family predicted phage terminase small subunit
MGSRGPVAKPADQRQGHRKQPRTASKPAQNGVISLVSRDAERAIPRPPTGLLAASRKRWKAYWQSPVSKAVDLDADLYRIERWISCVDEYERVNVAFKKTRLVKGSTGQAALNPLASYLQQLLNEINKAEAELGLTPLARMRLGIAYGEAKLTALELARAIDELDAPAIEAGLLEGEWEAV